MSSWLVWMDDIFTNPNISVMYFNHKRFNEWEKENRIPTKIMDMVNWIAEKIGEPVYEENIPIRNRMGETCGYARGFIITHCTSSYEDGSSVDYAPEFLKWLGGLGFELGDSYGDNGMDSATNWHDTYWHKEIIYKPSIIYDDFREFEDEEEEEAYRESCYERDWYDDY